MSYTLGTAAKATGKSKATISRAIKNGRISARKNGNGTFSIDPAELHRVYDPLPMDVDETVGGKDARLPNETAMLRLEVVFLRERLDELKNERDSWKSQAERLLLVCDRPPRRRSLFHWLGISRPD